MLQAIIPDAPEEFAAISVGGFNQQGYNWAFSSQRSRIMHIVWH
jgi:hypothetical protein